MALKSHRGSTGPPASAVSADVPRHVYVSRDELARSRGADPEAVDRIRRFAASQGLTVGEVSAAQRTVRLAGSVEDFNRAFGVDLHSYEVEGETYRGRTGAIHLPADLIGDVEAVLGLDNRKQVRHSMRRALDQAGFLGYPPPTIAGFYGFPTDIAGQGQCVGIAEFGGGFQQAGEDRRLLRPKRQRRFPQRHHSRCE